MITVYASIGNSDDKLTQRDWSTYATRFFGEIRRWAENIHGIWHSLPDSKYQNACACFEIDETEADRLKVALAGLALMYRQDSIAWAVAETTFIEGIR